MKIDPDHDNLPIRSYNSSGPGSPFRVGPEGADTWRRDSRMSEKMSEEHPFEVIESILMEMTERTGTDINDIETATVFFTESLEESEIDLSILAAYFIEKFFGRLLEMKGSSSISPINSEDLFDFTMSDPPDNNS